MFYPKTTIPTLTYCSGPGKIKTKPLSPPPVLWVQSEVWRNDGKNVRSDQKQQYVPRSWPKISQQRKRPSSSKYPNVVLISTWSEGKPEFRYSISIMRAWESITSSSNGLLRLLTFNCRVSVCLRKISGVPGIFPSQPQRHFLLMWDQMFVANPCFPHPSIRFISDRSIAAAGWSFKQKIAFFPLKLQHRIVGS